jgi:hypothetical protein
VNKDQMLASFVSAGIAAFGFGASVPPVNFAAWNLDEV